MDYEIALRRPRLTVRAIDITPASIKLAQRYHALPNIEYACQMLESVEGQFDCIFFSDVFHHARPQEYNALLQAGKRLLAPGGYILIKDVERRRGQVGFWMDRYISGCAEVFLQNCDELESVVARHLTVQTSEVRFRFPFPHFYIKALHTSDSAIKLATY